MKMYSFLLSSALLALAGCGNDDDNNPAPAASGTSPVIISEVREVDCSIVAISGTVNIQNNSFSPNSETVLVDQAVAWNNLDGVNHTVTSGLPGSPTGKFDINLAPNEKKCAIFTKAGSFNYFCRIHPNMTAKIEVESDQSDQ